MEFLLENFWAILSVAPITLLLAICAMIFGLLIGLFCAFVQIYNIPIINKLVIIYLAVIRGTPVLVLLFISYYGIPQLMDGISDLTGMNLSVNNVHPIVFAVIALTMDRSVYLTEAIRSAILSVPKGQMEACQSVGMTAFQAYCRIIIPQALLVAIPNFVNLFLGAIKESSLASVVSVVEMMNMANIQATDSYRYLEIFLIVSIVYWIICMTIELIVSRLEKKLSY